MTRADELSAELDALIDQHYGPGWRDQPEPIPQMVKLCLDCIAAKRAAELREPAMTLAQKMRQNERDRNAVIDLMLTMPGIRRAGL